VCVQFSQIDLKYVFDFEMAEDKQSNIVTGYQLTVMTGPISNPHRAGYWTGNCLVQL